MKCTQCKHKLKHKTYRISIDEPVEPVEKPKAKVKKITAKTLEKVLALSDEQKHQISGEFMVDRMNDLTEAEGKAALSMYDGKDK